MQGLPNCTGFIQVCTGFAQVRRFYLFFRICIGAQGSFMCTPGLLKCTRSRPLCRICVRARKCNWAVSSPPAPPNCVGFQYVHRVHLRVRWLVSFKCTGSAQLRRARMTAQGPSKCALGQLKCTGSAKLCMSRVSAPGSSSFTMGLDECTGSPKTT